MRRYWLFSFEAFAAEGGMDDFRFDFDSPWEAADDFYRTEFQHGHVVDTATGEIWEMFCRDYDELRAEYSDPDKYPCISDIDFGQSA